MINFTRDMAPYFIAEVGQNHNGSLAEALRYIQVFSAAGANAVKFQTRDNKYLFSEEAYKAPYNSDNSFGATYGEHREHLELSREDLLNLKDECRRHRVDFMSTPFDEPSIDLLMEVGVDLFKVASFDLGNLPLLKLLVDTQKPIVLSVGGGRQEHIDVTVKFLLQAGANFTVLHCVSQYPCPPEALRLGRIPKLLEKYPDVCIGSSDHFSGILSGPVAHMLGARVFEKHVTLNRAQKGTDQAFSLEATGFNNFVRDINRTDQMLKDEEPADIGDEPVFKKLGKSVVAARKLEKGERLELNKISGKIFTDKGVPVRESFRFIGREILRDIEAGEMIFFEDLG